MNVRLVPGTHIAVVDLRIDPDADEFCIDDLVLAVDGAGDLVGIEVLDTRRFGDPFDDAAAARAVAWAREQLAARAIG